MHHYDVLVLRLLCAGSSSSSRCQVYFFYFRSLVLFAQINFQLVATALLFPPSNEQRFELFLVM